LEEALRRPSYTAAVISGCASKGIGMPRSDFAQLEYKGVGANNQQLGKLGSKRNS